VIKMKKNEGCGRKEAGVNSVGDIGHVFMERWY
jgi:hypothetical protein